MPSFSACGGGSSPPTRLALSLDDSLDDSLSLERFDEPFAGVDPIAVEDIQTIVARLADERGIGVLITDHNVHETLAITDRTYLMFEGSIIKSGTAEELASDEVVRRVYLGQNFNLRRSGRRA